MTNSFRRWIFFKAGMPLLYAFGLAARIDRERLQGLLININNRLVRKTWKGPVTRLLLMLPHCIQRSECKVRITFDVNNCERCGKCPVAEFIDVSERKNLKLSVATGGGIARRTVDKIRPDAVVAVACERDLISGIRDIYPVPALGILNERPFGPCFNTRVDVDTVIDAITFFAG
ncbi:MAG: DUF116 domain-containing protein [Nitrospirae bacterium]|nr:DUF116 domain-containing protein [Nitrospirota bacterium]